jgi:thioredoxin-like negative regulator of GroEL
VSAQNNFVSVQDDPKNTLGLIYSIKQIEQASGLLKEGKTEDAEKILLNVKGWLTGASENHYKLFQAFSKNQKKSKSAKLEKAHALDFANARDRCYFLLAKIYIGQKKIKDAVGLLVDIVSSQSDTEIGNSAYKLLQEIKFSDKS